MENKSEAENAKEAESINKGRRKDDRPKSRWKGIFEDVTYSSGPGDNIFIYG